MTGRSVAPAKSDYPGAAAQRPLRGEPRTAEAGLARLREMGAAGCCLVGHPDYYPRFGFRNTPGFGVEGVPAEVFFALPFAGHLPQGQVTFREAFGTGH